MTAQDTPTREVLKSTRPQGSSPIARDSNNLDLPGLDLNLGDNNDNKAFEAKEDADSISRMIASTRKELFKASGGEAAQGNQDGGNMATASMQGKQKSWKPIAKQAAAVAEGPGSRKKGASFARLIVFNKKMAPDKDDAEKKSTKHYKCVICIQFKMLHRTKDVQETLIRLLDYCLRTLHKQDKTASILNRKKTLEA
jgi:hypothetical protein